MSVFTNAAAGSKKGAKEYVQAVTGLIKGLEPLEVMTETPNQLAQAVEGLTRDEIAVPEKPGKWSILQVVQHLADSELVFGYRIRRALAEETPRLEGYDQDLWAEKLRYNDGDLDESLALFAALRRSNLRLLRPASPNDLKRTSRHDERGEEVLGDMVRLYAGHDVLHLRQIGRIRKATKSERRLRGG